MKGNVHEIFSSYQGEGGSARGSCTGRRQIFVRFAGCNLAQGAMGTKGCIFCDSPEAAGGSGWVKLECHPGRGDFSRARNPVSSEFILRSIGRLVTRDLHSVSLTGGEPLCQPGFLGELARTLRGRGFVTYLETNGSLPAAAAEVAGALDLACVDVKDRSACAASAWRDLVALEIGTIEALTERGVRTFAKLVVSEGTRPRDVELISKRLHPFPCDLTIQVVTSRGGLEAPCLELLFDITEAAAKHLQPDRLSVSAQIHRLIGMR